MVVPGEPKTLQCRECGTAASGIESRCSSCGALTGLLQPGQYFYWRRFLLKECLRAGTRLISWKVRDEIEKEECMLSEYVGTGVLSQQQQHDFVEYAAGFAQLKDFVEPPRYAFTFRGRPFIVKNWAPRRTLRDLAAGGGVSEEKASSVFFTLLQHLECLHKLDPPLFLGPASLADISVADDGSLRFWSVTSPHLQDSHQIGPLDDMRTIARLACQLLIGGSSEGVSERPVARWQERVQAANDAGFAAAVECLICGIPAPENAARIFELAGLVRQGTQLLQEKMLDQACARLESAARIAYTPRIQQLIAQIESGRLPTRRHSASSASKGQMTDQVARAGTGPERASSPEANSVSQPTAPESRPEAQPVVDKGGTSTASPHGVLKICPKCGHIFDRDRFFCENDGSRLNEIAFPNSAPTPAPELKLLHLHEGASPGWSMVGARLHWKKWLLAGCAAAGVILILLYQAGAPRREFLQLVEAGQLVSRDSRSAYAVFRKLASERGAGDSLVKELAVRIRPELDRLSRAKFDQWRQSSDIAPLSWTEMAQLEEWRALIEPSAENRAREAYSRGMAALSEKDPSGAQRWFHEALRYKPGWALALNGLGRASFQLADFARAEQYYREAAAADPLWPFPRVNLANLYRDVLRRPEQAEALYLEAIRLQPERGSFYFALANFYFARGSVFRAQACQNYRAALAKLSSGSLTQGEADLARRRVANYCPE